MTFYKEAKKRFDEDDGFKEIARAEVCVVCVACVCVLFYLPRIRARVVCVCVCYVLFATDTITCWLASAAQEARRPFVSEIMVSRLVIGVDIGFVTTVAGLVAVGWV